MEKKEGNPRAMLDAWEALKLHQRIGIDIDGVLVDFTKLFIDELNLRFKTDYSPKQMDDWSFTGSLGISRQMEAMIWNSRGLLDRMIKAPPLDTGRELCELLSMTGKKLHYVTSRGYSQSDEYSRQALARLTDRWLAENDFPFGSVTHWHDKWEVAENFGLSAFIEDSPFNALQLANRGVRVVLVDAPYNQGVNNELITRVGGWT